MPKSECLMDMYHDGHGIHMSCNGLVCTYIRTCHCMYVHTLAMWAVQLHVHGNTDIPSLVHSICVHGLLAPPSLGCTSHCGGSVLTTALTG